MDVISSDDAASGGFCDIAATASASGTGDGRAVSALAVPGFQISFANSAATDFVKVISPTKLELCFTRQRPWCECQLESMTRPSKSLPLQMAVESIQDIDSNTANINIVIDRDFSSSNLDHAISVINRNVMSSSSSQAVAGAHASDGAAFHHLDCSCVNLHENRENVMRVRELFLSIKVR